MSFWDSGGTLRLKEGSSLVRSGLLAIPLADQASPLTSGRGVVTPPGFPVTAGAPWAIAFSVFSNIAGLCVDDDGNVYFQQLDLITFSGGNIVKVTSLDIPDIADAPGFQDRSLAVKEFVTLTTLNPRNETYGVASGIPASQLNLFRKVYSGTSTTFGNVVALACGPDNTVYAAASPSLAAAQGMAAQPGASGFTNPADLGPTPSMIITFSIARALSTPAPRP